MKFHLHLGVAGRVIMAMMMNYFTIRIQLDNVFCIFFNFNLFQAFTQIFRCGKLSAMTTYCANAAVIEAKKIARFLIQYQHRQTEKNANTEIIANDNLSFIWFKLHVPFLFVFDTFPQRMYMHSIPILKMKR